MRKVQLQFQLRRCVIRAFPTKLDGLVFIIRLHWDCKSRPSHIICFEVAVCYVGVVERLHRLWEVNNHFAHVVYAANFRNYGDLINYHFLLISQFLCELRLLIIAGHCEQETSLSFSKPIGHNYFYQILAFKITGQLVSFNVDFSWSGIELSKHHGRTELDPLGTDVIIWVLTLRHFSDKCLTTTKNYCFRPVIWSHKIGQNVWKFRVYRLQILNFKIEDPQSGRQRNSLTKLRNVRSFDTDYFLANVGRIVRIVSNLVRDVDGYPGRAC